MLAPAADLPLEQVVKSGNVAMLVTERGGHIGFMESFVWLFDKERPGYLMEHVFKQYMEALFKLQEKPMDFFAAQ